jgi:hypothetical protein
MLGLFIFIQVIYGPWLRPDRGLPCRASHYIRHVDVAALPHGNGASVACSYHRPDDHRRTGNGFAGRWYPMIITGICLPSLVRQRDLHIDIHMTSPRCARNRRQSPQRRAPSRRQLFGQPALDSNMWGGIRFDRVPPFHVAAVSDWGDCPEQGPPARVGSRGSLCRHAHWSADNTMSLRCVRSWG